MDIMDLVNIETIKSGKSIAKSFSKDEVTRESFNKILEQRISQRREGSYIKKTHMKARDKRLMNACIDMESIFVARMLKAMRNTLPKEKLIHGGFAEDIFEDMLYDEFALKLSKTANLGIANMLYGELSKI